MTNASGCLLQNATVFWENTTVITKSDYFIKSSVGTNAY